MARHSLDTYGDLDRQAVPDKLRRSLHRKIIERDKYARRSACSAEASSATTTSR